eukprot:11761139-Alexandrium_andersonii.AAC.1
MQRTPTAGRPSKRLDRTADWGGDKGGPPFGAGGLCPLSGHSWTSVPTSANGGWLLGTSAPIGSAIQTFRGPLNRGL